MNRTLIAAIVALLVAATLGAGYFAGRGAQQTVTVTTSQTPSSGEIVGPTDGIDLTGCSISNKTCTFLITNVVQPSSLGITLDETNPPCVTLTYNTGGSVDSFVTPGATSCTYSPSNFISSTGGSITLTAVFPAFGPPSPKVGQSVYGCIRYTTTIGSVTDYGCLAFLGVFTSSNTAVAVATVTVTQTLTTLASQATTTYANPTTGCTEPGPIETTTTTITVGPTPPAYTITVTVTTTATNYTQTLTVTSCTYSYPTVTSTTTTTVDP